MVLSNPEQIYLRGHLAARGVLFITSYKMSISNIILDILIFLLVYAWE